MTRPEAHTNSRIAPLGWLVLLWGNPEVLRAPVLARLRASLEARQEALAIEEEE